MATVPDNILQQVITYNDADLAYLQNQNCFIGTLNTKYKDFQTLTANLGNTVNLELPYRAITGDGLVITVQGVQQRLHPLVCDQAAYSANDFTEQQFIFNVKDYMEKFGKARINSLGSKIEQNVALNATSGVPRMTINSQGQSVPTGQLHVESGPFLFYGNGTDSINSFQQLATADALLKDFGAAKGELDVYLDNMAIPQIIGSSLTQFVQDRNEKTANSWDLGTYKGSGNNHYRSNLLPIHYAGTCGENDDPLVLVSTNDATGQNITNLTFSGVSVNSGAIKSGDLFQFDAGQGLNYLTWTGYHPSKNLVQFRATQNADGVAGTVSFDIYPALRSVVGLNQNLTKALSAGATATAMPSHRAGLMVGGKAFYLSMPRLGSTSPFVNSSMTDPETAVSLRSYFGFIFGQNQTVYVNDCIWASTLVPEYCMRMLFPL